MCAIAIVCIAVSSLVEGDVMNEQSAGRQIAAIDDRRGAVVSAPISDGDSLLAVISKAARRSRRQRR